MEGRKAECVGAQVGKWVIGKPGEDRRSERMQPQRDWAGRAASSGQETVSGRAAAGGER